MFRSVRSRLTWWYTGILAMVLGVFSVLVYARLSRDAYGDVDASLASSIDVLSLSLRHEIDEHLGKLAGEEAFQGVVASVYKNSFPGIGLVVTNENVTVAAKPGTGGSVPKVPVGLPEGYRTEDRSGGKWRIANIAISIPQGGNYTFVAETSLTRVGSEMTQLRNVFYTAIPIALAIAAAGGYLLARKSLAPVVVMSSSVEKMSTEDLSQRVEVAHQQDELGKLASTFNRLLERIERAFESQRQFMADSSHELQTPMYVARMATDVILSAPSRTEEEYRDALTTVQQQMRRLSHIVEGMFLLAHADAGAYPLKMEEFYLDEVISECLRAAKVLAHPKGIEVVGPELTEMPCRGDEGLIRQLILVLLDNAVKYTPNRGRVQLNAAFQEPGTYVLEVSDTGIGIPKDAQERIFTRFFRVDRTNSRTAGDRKGGAGLGLAIAHWIAQAHQGTLTLVESSSSGSTFQIRLPREAVEKQPESV